MFLAPPHVIEQRRQAKHLYWAGWGVTQIAEFLELKRPTVESWKQRDKWDEAPSITRVEGALECRLIQLIAKDVKTGGDFKEIDLLGRQVERLARVRRYGEPGGHEGDLNPNIEARNAGPKKKPKRNSFTKEQVVQLLEAFKAELFGYQDLWRRRDDRSRMILKARQIGATWYFAREALADALETGRNQIFLSASKSQAHIFRQYIVAFAKAACGVELTGDPIVIEVEGREEPVTLYFLGTNWRTAQGYHGNLYFDEFFWTFRFNELKKVASGMAMHKKWRKTYFSTPSSVAHEAYAFWTGEEFNRRRPKAERKKLDVSWKALKDGAVGPDRIWRQIVTIADAERGGCDLFDIEELRLEYSADQFENLLMCGFIDDAMSMFPLATLQPCMVDAWADWEDFAPLTARPYAGEVWIGYDPSLTGDSAALVVVAPPAEIGKGTFRILEKHRFQGMNFAAQATAIEEVTKRYHVTKIDIDATGLGQGVYQLVLAFFPTARGLNYTPELKSLMVLKAQDTVRRLRLQYDAAWNDLTASFMAINKTLTGSGRSVTYEAGRSEETGHADLAWAVMHTLINEPLEAPQTGGARKGFLEIYD